MTLYVIGGLVLLLLAALWYAARLGRKSGQADTLKKGLDNARDASKTREDVARLSDADLDRELRDN